MLLYGIVWVSLILSYLTEVRRAPVMGENVTGGKAVPTPVAKA
jgi:NNP family nitrate/nitrite transporter-like MFS transporter